MKEINIRNGWRNPNEEPKQGYPLLVVLKLIDDNTVFTTIEWRGIENARTHFGYKLLAWQYLPGWKE